MGVGYGKVESSMLGSMLWILKKIVWIFMRWVAYSWNKVTHFLFQIMMEQNFPSFHELHKKAGVSKLI